MKRFKKSIVVLWIYLIYALCFHDVAFADKKLATGADYRYRWHVRTGMQVAHQNPDFRYVPVSRDDVTAWNSNRDIPLTTFSFVSLQRDLGDDSSIELSYISDGAGGKVYGKQFFFTYVVTSI